MSDREDPTPGGPSPWEELAPEATIRKFRIVQTEGNRAVSRLGGQDNLDALPRVEGNAEITYDLFAYRTDVTLSQGGFR